MKTKTGRILTVALIFQLLAFSACAAWLVYDAKVDRSGWAEKGGVRYYRDFHAKPVTGWLDIDGQRYFFLEGGIPATGWLDQDGGTRYFGSDGVMHTGWLTAEDGMRYYQADGTMATDWQEIGGKRYCFGENGVAATGWYQEGEYSYYFLPDGSAAVGPTEIDGVTHYFTPKGMEVILVNAAHPIPDYYTADPVIVEDWHRVDRRCYEPLMQMLSDCADAGIEYIFNCGYRTLQEQTDILEKRTREHMEEFDLDFDEARKMALETVAVPGTSEHQMGLAVDIVGEEANAWLGEHCWEYGFILRYTEEKAEITGITNEPWHFRYVGKEISMDMKDSGLCLEEYLGAV